MSIPSRRLISTGFIVPFHPRDNFHLALLPLVLIYDKVSLVIVISTGTAHTLGKVQCLEPIFASVAWVQVDSEWLELLFYLSQGLGVAPLIRRFLLPAARPIMLLE